MRRYAILFSAVLVLAGTGIVKAGWIQSVGQSFADFDQWRLDHTPEQFTGPRPGREFTMLAVHNNTNKPIQFAACWEPWQNPHDNSSRLSYMDNGRSSWTAQYWYRVLPGQVVHFGNTTNGVFYTFARQEGTGAYWSGGDQINFGGPGVLHCKKHIFIGMPLEFTAHLNQ